MFALLLLSRYTFWAKMDFSFKLGKQDKKFRARAGVIITPHGKIETPAFSVVATRAVVRALDVDDLKAAGTQLVLGNTYHLYLRPGTETLEKFGGFAPFMGWDGPTITDSGGYQVSFLWQGGKNQENLEAEETGRVVKITDEGALFASHLDGSKHLITPEQSMLIQQKLGADVIMSFDQPLGSDYSEIKKEEAFGRTLLWEERSFKAWQKQEEFREKGTFQALFGIIQGELDREMRRQCTEFVLGLDFPGLAIGGQSIGKDPRVTASVLDMVSDLLPDNKPLHALGLGGGPEGIFEAVERGVDLFDNSSITRQARNGLLFLSPEDGGQPLNKFRLDLTKSQFKEDQEPISRGCHCFTCQKYSRAYLHHLFMSKELLSYRLASIHNVFFINDLMAQIRKAILNDNFTSLKRSWLRSY